MRRAFSCLVALLAIALYVPAMAEDMAPAAPEVTLSGTMMCAKCALKEEGGCRNVLQVTDGDAKVNYYLAANKVSKDFHKNVCSGTAQTTVVGTVAEEGGKKILTASSITKTEG